MTRKQTKPKEKPKFTITIDVYESRMDSKVKGVVSFTDVLGAIEFFKITHSKRLV